MNYGRADPARIGVVALAAVALLLALIYLPNPSSYLGQRSQSLGNSKLEIGNSLATSLQPSVIPRTQIDNRQSTIDNGAAAPRLVASYGRLPLSFEANQGQTDSQVKFLSRGRGYTMFLTSNEAVLSLRSQKSGVRSQPPTARNSKLETGNWPIWNLPSEISNRQSLLAHPTDYGPRTTDRALLSIDNRQSAINNSSDKAPTVLRMTLVGANANAKVTGMNPLPGKSNYFLGNDPKKWRTNVPTYAKVKYKSVYPGIDLVYYGKSSVVSSQLSVETLAGQGANEQGQLEFDFVVSPGADPRAIALEIGTPLTPSPSPRGRGWPGGPGEGTSPRIDSNGDLVIATAAGEVRFHKPVVYQPNPESRTPNPGSSNSQFTIHNQYCPIKVLAIRRNCLTGRK